MLTHTHFNSHFPGELELAGWFPLMIRGVEVSFLKGKMPFLSTTQPPIKALKD